MVNLKLSKKELSDIVDLIEERLFEMESPRDDDCADMDAPQQKRLLEILDRLGLEWKYDILKDKGEIRKKGE